MLTVFCILKILWFLKMLLKLGETIRPFENLHFLPCYLTAVECTAGLPQTWWLTGAALHPWGGPWPRILPAQFPMPFCLPLIAANIMQQFPGSVKLTCPENQCHIMRRLENWKHKDLPATGYIYITCVTTFECQKSFTGAGRWPAYSIDERKSNVILRSFKLHCLKGL